MPPLPLGFEHKNQAQEQESSIENSVEKEDSSFLYYDASCDIAESIDYIRFGRGKNKLSNKEAVALYQSAIDTASAESNYGGCISRSLVKLGRPWVNPSPLTNRTNQEWFVVGLGRDFLLNDANQDAALSSLLETLATNENIAGFFADLDYTTDTLNRRAGCDLQSQLKRLECTCQAAAEANVAIQIRTSPGASSSCTTDSDDSTTLYHAQVMKDLADTLTAQVAKYPLLQVHLSSWSGNANDMLDLLQNFPTNVWFGLDSTVTFAKASHVHECAFDVPLNRILLETGANSIPSVVTKSMGRHAFSSSGLVPFIALAIAEIKKVDATTVARAATENTCNLYPKLLVSGGRVVSSEETVPSAKKEM